MVQGNEPLYMDIYKQLLNNIREGLYSDGKLPTEREVAEDYQVSRITSKKAFELLVAQGYVRRIPGKGTFLIPGRDEKREEDAYGDGSGRTQSSGTGELLRQTERAEAGEAQMCIGLIIEEIGESFGALTVAGVERSCARNGCSLLLRCSYGNQKKEEEAIGELIRAGAKGLIVMPVHGVNYNPAILRLSVEKFPLVIIDRELKGIPASFVGTDNFQASVEMTNYLFELGHREICFSAPTDNGTSSILERRRGFIEANLNRGILIRENRFIDGIKSTLPYYDTAQMMPGDIRLIMEYIRNNPGVTAFFAAEYNIALIIYKAVRNLGYRIPEDISIVCFDSPPNFVGDYLFTFMRQNESMLGDKSVGLLLDAIGGAGEIKNVYMGAELIQGIYTGRAKERE